MKSSSGQYFRSLDHVRALAAFLVFAWHFNHVRGGEQDAPLGIGLSFLTEGHTGVAIFMTLSGYLFAKLLDGQSVRLGPFLWNRLLRLGPLLLVVILLVAIEQALRGTLGLDYLGQVFRGLVQPTLPNGGWSITVEAHFYVLLPLLLALGARDPRALLWVLVVAVALRAALYLRLGQIQDLAYWTIVGRIDQFLCGILAFRLRGAIAGRPGRALAVAAGSRSSGGASTGAAGSTGARPIPRRPPGGSCCPRSKGRPTAGSSPGTTLRTSVAGPPGRTGRTPASPTSWRWRAPSPTPSTCCTPSWCSGSAGRSTRMWSGSPTVPT